MGALYAVRCDVVLSMRMSDFDDLFCNYCTVGMIPVVQVSICNLVHSFVTDLIRLSQRYVESPLGMIKVVLWCTVHNSRYASMSETELYVPNVTLMSLGHWRKQEKAYKTSYDAN
jgi:hypothetical protein